MGKYVDAVLDKKPNEFKELVLSGIQDRVRSAIEKKRVEVGKSMFEAKKDDMYLELKDAGDMDLSYNFDSVRDLLDDIPSWGDVSKKDIEEVFMEVTGVLDNAIDVAKFYKEKKGAAGIAKVLKDVNALTKTTIKTKNYKSAKKALKKIESDYNKIRKTLKTNVNA